MLKEGWLRLRRRPGFDVTLPVTRIDRLDGDLLGVRVPDAYLELDVPKGRLDSVLGRLGHSAPGPPG